jgi:hypothetical protein
MIGRGSAGRLPSRACANNRDMQLGQLVTSNITKRRRCAFRDPVGHYAGQLKKNERLCYGEVYQDIR